MPAKSEYIMHRYPGEVPEARIKGGIERGCKMTLSKIEQETIIIYNELEKTANIDTCNKALSKKLKALEQERPEEARFVREDSFGVRYIVPKKWVKVNPGKVLTEEQKQKLSDMAKQRGLGKRTE